MISVPNVEERPNVAIGVVFAIERGLRESHVGCDGCARKGIVSAIEGRLFVRLY